MNKVVCKRPKRRIISTEKFLQFIQNAEQSVEKGYKRVEQQRAKLFK